MFPAIWTHTQTGKAERGCYGTEQEPPGKFEGHQKDSIVDPFLGDQRAEHECRACSANVQKLPIKRAISPRRYL